MRRIIGLFLSLLLCSVISCAPPKNPVYSIAIIPRGELPSTFIMPPDYMPFPTYIRAIPLNLRIELYLYLDKKFQGEATFSKFTTYNGDTKVESIVSEPDDLGPFKPDSVLSWVIDNPGLGNYELRIYYQDRIVAAAPFVVE